MKKKKEHKHQHNPPGKKSLKPSGSDSMMQYGAILVLVIIALIVYLPALNGGFVWDDDDYIKNNTLIHTINLKEIFTHYVMGNYHPLTVLVYAFEYHFFGVAEKGYHAINMMLHCLNTILVFYVIFRLSEKTVVAFVAAILFAVHPIHVESVAWASELKDLLYTFFFLASYIFYLKYLKENQKKFIVYSVLLFLLSLLSKAMAASLPVALLLTDYFKGGKITTKTFINKAPYFALAIIFGVVAVFAQKSSGATDIAVFPFPQRIIFACYGFFTYLFNLVLPMQFSAYYPYPIRPGADLPSQYYLYPVLMLVLLAGLFYSLKSSKKILFGIGFFAVTVFLVLQLLPVGGAIMADRYCYIPSIGIFYLAGEAFFGLWNRKSYKYPAIIAISAFVVFFSSKTYARCSTWKNGLTLWTDVIDQYQTIGVAYNNRGIILANQKRIDEAMSDYNKAIQLEPKFPRALNNRGVLLKGQKKYEEALSDFNKAIELDPTYSSPYNNRGVIYKIQNKLDEAVLDFNKAIELKSTYTEAYFNRGNTRKMKSNYDGAVSDYEKAIELRPNYAEAYYNKGLSEYDSGKKDVGCKDMQHSASLGYQPAIDSFASLCH